MLTWEYPPLTGGAAAHVDGLSRALATAGHDVVVLTVAGPGPVASPTDAIRVLRATRHLPVVPEESAGNAAFERRLQGFIRCTDRPHP